MPVALVQYSPQKLQNRLYALVYDQWHVSARGLRYLHEKSGADECYLAIFIISGISIYLIIGDYARFVANTILIAVPILLTYVYPEERPPFDNLLYYWSIYVIATLFFDPELEDKGSYYWVKMLLLILLIVFPREADVVITKQHNNENNHQEDLNKKDISDKVTKHHFQITRQQQSRIMKKPQVDAVKVLETDSFGTTPVNSSAFSAKTKIISTTKTKKIPNILKEHCLPAKTQQNQILSEKRQLSPLVLQMKPQIDSAVESSIHTKDESQTISTGESLVVPNAFVEKSQTVLPEKFESITETKGQFDRPLGKPEVLQEEKFLETTILKPEIIITPIARKSQILSSSKLQTTHEDISQPTSVKISQSTSVRPDKTTFVKEPQTIPARKLQPVFSKEHDITCEKIDQTVPKKESQVIAINKPQNVVIRKTQSPSTKKPETSYFKIVQIENKKKAEGSSITLPTGSMEVPAKVHLRESEIGSGLDRETTSVKESESVRSEQLKILTEKKFKELQNVPMKKSQTLLTDVPEIISTNEIPLTPLKISMAASTDKSRNIFKKETEESQLTSEHELRTDSVEKSHIFPAEESQTLAVKEHQMLNEKESRTIPTFENGSIVRNSSTVGLHVTSLKESDMATETEIHVNHRKEVINTPEKQSPTISDTSTDPKENEDTEREISQDVSEGKKSANAITWVATGKTVVLMQNAQTKKPNESR